VAPRPRPNLSFLEKIDLLENWSIYCVPLRRWGAMTAEKIDG
jgi:hypothetical protein